MGRKGLLKAGLALAATAWSGGSSAATITFTVTGFANGTAAGAPISSSFVLTAVGDTANVQTCANPGGPPIPGCTVLFGTNMKIDIAGQGVFNFQNPGYVFSNSGPNIYGFGEVNPTINAGIRTFLFGNSNLPGFPRASDFLTYDMVSNLGPVSTSSFVLGFPGPPFNIPYLTDRGAIVFGLSPTVAATFQAVVSPSVPEPASWALMIAGFGMAGAAMRVRKKTVRITFS